MSPEVLFVLCLVIATAILTTGIVFLNRGYKGNGDGHPNYTFVTIGWIIVGTISLIVTGGLIFLIVETSWMVGFLFVLLPLIILIGLAVTLSYGIYCLIVGYNRDSNGHFNTSKIRAGWISIGINLTIMLAIFTLLLMFMTGIIPIRLM